MRAPVVLAFVLTSSVASAQQFVSPEDTVNTLYGAYLANIEIRDFRPYFSDRLSTEMGGLRIGQSQMKALGFDPIVGTQRWVLTDFRLREVKSTGHTASVAVSFDNGGAEVSMAFDLINEPRFGWQIDHISGTAGSFTWCTNNIVALSAELQTPKDGEVSPRMGASETPAR